MDSKAFKPSTMNPTESLWVNGMLSSSTNPANALLLIPRVNRSSGFLAGSSKYLRKLSRASLMTNLLSSAARPASITAAFRALASAAAATAPSDKGDAVGSVTASDLLRLKSVSNRPLGALVMDWTNSESSPSIISFSVLPLNSVLSSRIECILFVARLM